MTPTNKLLRFVKLMQQHNEWLTLITISKAQGIMRPVKKEFKEWA